MLQEGNSGRKLAKEDNKDSKAKAEISWVDFLRPEFLLGSLLRGEKLPEGRKAPKLILLALLFTGIVIVVYFLLFKGEQPSWLQPWPMISSVLITIFVFAIILLIKKSKRTNKPGS